MADEVRKMRWCRTHHSRAEYGAGDGCEIVDLADLIASAIFIGLTESEGDIDYVAERVIEALGGDDE